MSKFEIKCHLITNPKWLLNNSCENEVMLFSYWLMLPNCLIEWQEQKLLHAREREVVIHMYYR